MNYLQRKRYALMMNRNFRGTLKTSIGNPVTLENCRNDYPANMTVSGNTYQGNPDDNCIDILDVYDNPDSTLYNQYKYKYIKLKPNTAYTLSTNAPVTETNSGTKAGLFYIFSGKNTSTWLWSFTRAGVASENAPATWCTDSEGYLTIMILVTGGKINCTRENLLDGTYWVMLNEGETALEYKPYTALSSTNPQELQSCGDMTVNLADQANVYLGTNSSNRVPYPNRTSKGYILDNSINRISLIPCKIEEGKTYTCSYDTEYITGDLPCSVFYIKNPEEGLMQYLQNGKSFVANFDATLLGIYVSLGEGETNPNTGEPAPLNQIRISEVMLNEGDTALPYEPYGHYKIPVEQNGNLFNLRDTTADHNGYTVFSLEEEDYISLEKDNSSATGTTYSAYYTEPSSEIKPSRLYTMFVEVKELSNCTLSAVTSASLAWAGQFKVGKGITSAGTYKITAVSRENLADCKTMLRTEVSTQAGKVGKAVFRISVFEGEMSTAVEDFVYQPYCDEVKKYNIYVPKQLCGIKGVNDVVTLDIENRTAVLTRNFSIYTMTKDSIIHFSDSDASEGKYFSAGFNIGVFNNRKGLCDYFKYSSNFKWGTYWHPDSRTIIGNLNSDGTKKFTSVDEFKEWIGDKIIHFYIQTVEPIVEDISDIQDWDSISKLNQGINIITIESTERPSDVEVKYYT